MMILRLRHLTNVPTRTWLWYKSMLKTHPWKTQIISTAAMMGAGDFLAQICVEQKFRNYRIADTARFTFLGAAYVAPVVQTWYLFMNKYIHGHPYIVPLKMILLDQLLFSPVSLVAFLLFLRALEGRSMKDNWALLRRDFWMIYTTGLTIWPFVQLIKFYLVPLRYRLVAAQAFALIWNTFVAYKSRVELDTGDTAVNIDGVDSNNNSNNNNTSVISRDGEKKL